MAVRESHGGNAFEDELAAFRKETAGAPAIRGIDRNSPDAYRVLYMKGPLLLHRLERAMGEEKFRELLRAFIEKRNRSTADLLALVEQIGSAKLSQELDAGLSEQ
jgi:hypothetical protein